MAITTETPRFDAAKYKQTTREQWQGAAKAWNEWGPFLRKWLGESTEAMFDMAGIAAGSRVPRCRRGYGDQTLHAADPSGRRAMCYRHLSGHPRSGSCERS
jgi:hypothetical protein